MEFASEEGDWVEMGRSQVKRVGLGWKRDKIGGLMWHEVEDWVGNEVAGLASESVGPTFGATG